MKYRRNKVKREHGIIQDALEWLEELSKNPQVSDIIPGVIEVSRSPERGIVYKYETKTGCKLLLKSNGSIQEAFVVTKDPAFVRAWVEERFPPGAQEKIREEGSKPEKLSKEKAQEKKQQFGSPQDNNYANSFKSKIFSQKAEREEEHLPESWTSLGDFDTANFGERLNSSTLQALKALKKQLSWSEKNKGSSKQ